MLWVLSQIEFLNYCNFFLPNLVNIWVQFCHNLGFKDFTTRVLSYEKHIFFSFLTNGVFEFSHNFNFEFGPNLS